MLHKALFLTALVAVVALAGCSPADAPDSSAAAPVTDPAAEETVTSTLTRAEDHFHPKGKAPSEYTLEIFEEARNTLPFSDRDDFAEWERGFIARREDLKIMADAGNVAWDMERYLFLDEPEKINSVHPSLLRMSLLNNNYGLYEVIPGIYQVRGFDLSQVTFVRGKTGWIVFDPATTLETARAAKQLVDEHLDVLPVVAVIYSHSHVDHYGGVRGHHKYLIPNTAFKPDKANVGSAAKAITMTRCLTWSGSVPSTRLPNGR